MFFILPFLISSANSLPTESPDQNKTTIKDCTTGIFSPTCLKISVISLLEKLNSKDEVQLLPGLTLVKEGVENNAEIVDIVKSLPNTDERLDKFLLYRLGSYLDTHSVKLKLLDNNVVDEARAIGEARKKDPLGIGGKKGGLGSLIAMAMMMKGLATALPNPEVGTVNTNENTIESDGNAKPTARGIAKDCANGVLSPTCLKIEAVALLEKLSSKDELPILPGVSVVKEPTKEGAKAEEFAAELARSMPSKPEERLDKYLLYRLGNYLDTHSVKLKLMDDSATEQARNLLSEARGKNPLGGGKKGGMGGLLAAALMMKGTLMSVGLGGLALLAGKALMTAMMSLLLSAIIGIKSLTSGGKSTTYEIVSKPIYSHSHSHSTGHEDAGAYGHSGYGRNLNVRRR